MIRQPLEKKIYKLKVELTQEKRKTAELLDMLQQVRCSDLSGQTTLSPYMRREVKHAIKNAEHP